MIRKSSRCILFFLLIVSSKLFATHAAGAELTYRYISTNGNGDVYEITCTLYRDCYGVAAPTTLPITVSSVSCAFAASSYSLPKIIGTGQEITLPCSTTQTMCTNSGSLVDGFQKYMYRGNITLPYHCSDWIISYSVIARNCAITTIQQPPNCQASSMTAIYVEATLNNLNFTSNNSPTFSNNPIVYICLNQNFVFNPGIIEQEGDSLYIELIDALQAHNTSVPYILPYSGTNPLTSAPPVSIDHATGDITVNAQAFEIGIITIRINEYRNGALVGSVIRDMQFIVTDCLSNVLPTATGINGTTDYTITSCAGDTLSFFIYSDDTNAAQNVTMTWDSSIIGSTFTTAGSPHPTGTFSWVPTPQQARTQPYIFTVTVTDNNCPLNSFQTFSYFIFVPLLSVQSVVTPCSSTMASDGAIDLFPNGGTPPYSYLWIPGGETTEDVDSLSQGVYGVIITDSNGCQATDTFLVFSCNGISASVQSPIDTNGYHISCNGNSDGLIIATVTGGTPPYTYDWGNGPGSDSTLVNLPAGFYSVTITDQWGCMLTESITLNEPDPIAHLGNATMHICNGSDTVVSEPTGYFYLWSTSDTTNMCVFNQQGLHSVVITDSFGCSITDTFTLQFYPLIDTSVTGSLTFCEGDSVQFIAAAGYAYEWSTGETMQSIYVSDSGNVSVILTDIHNCKDSSAIFYVTEYLLPAAPDISVETDSLIVLNPIAGSYIWIMNGNSTGHTGPYYLYPGDGLYYCIYIDSNGCSSISDSILITGIRQITLSHFEITPNPTTGKCIITSKTNDPVCGLRVFNFQGEMISSDQLRVPSIRQEIDFSDYAEGIYFFQIYTTDTIAVVKVIVSR